MHPIINVHSSVDQSTNSKDNGRQNKQIWGIRCNVLFWRSTAAASFSVPGEIFGHDGSKSECFQVQLVLSYDLACFFCSLY